jgi:EAL domain-containing protein (putative c-di-GMP-specific phosphodiesterase class I)
LGEPEQAIAEFDEAWRVAQPFGIVGPFVEMNPSVPGLVRHCLHGKDEAMYKAKRQGPNVIEMFDEKLRTVAAARIDLLTNLRRAATAQELQLVYQPVVRIDDEVVVGAEALLRWNSSRYGTVPPDRFIPILESDPLFPELGEWILREAIAGSKKMRQQNPDFVVNVNLSYSQLEKPEFADRVLQILKEQGCPPSQVCLEVTERCRLLDLELLKNVVIRLKSSGIRIALDDFGTGFSSVDILKEIPFDTIKIDRSFVWDIEKKETACRLVQNLVALGALFGARVCVEGVETAGMRDILRQFRAHSFQGYYYARPLPPEELLQWKNPHP